MDHYAKTKSQLIAELEQIHQRIAELENRESQQAYQTLLNSVDGIVWEADALTFQFSFVSKQAERLLGYPVEDWLSPNFWADHLYPADRPQAIDFCREATMAGEDYELEYRMLTADGRLVWLRDMVRVVLENGEPVKLRGIKVDITKRKRAEAALLSSRGRLRNVITFISDHIYLTSVNPDGSKTNLYISPNVEELTGYPLEKFLDDWSFWSARLIHPDDRAAAAAQAEKLAAGQNSELEYRLVRADGRIIWVRDSGRVVGEPDGRRTVYGVVSDITGRKQVEQDLRRSNRELTLLNQIIGATTTILEPEALLEMTCRELAQACQVPRATALLLNKQKTRVRVAAEYGLEDQLLMLNKVLPVKNNPIIQQFLDYRRAPLAVTDAQNDPRLRPLHNLMRRRGAASLLIAPLVVEGEVAGSLNLETLDRRRFSAAEIDLAGRVADQVAGALMRLRLNEERRLLNAAIEQAAESVIITDTRGDILYVNPAFEEITGYSRAEAIGQNPRFLKSGRHNTAFYEELWAVITAGQVWRGRFINKKKNGDLYTEQAAITPVRDESEAIVNYVAVKRDVTRELQLEEQFRQAQKMESIGRLAGGVAHDFNNILTVILGHSEFLLSGYDDPYDPRRREVEQIEKAAGRATSLTRQLLAFSRQQPLEPQNLNLNQIVTNIEKMLTRLLGEDIILTTDLDPDLGWVRVDPNQMEQVLMNLAVNARDAMPQGGKLTIKTANIDLNDDYVERHLDMPPGPYVRLCVSDTGLGMDAETRRRIFEPFFTTKEVRQGTGLGLSTVHGIVRQSGGHIWVYSEPGQGAIFKIYLPRIAETAKPAPVRPDTFVSLKGAETILVVEDNEGVRLVTRKFLQLQGYTVLEAGSAEEGLQLHKQHEGRIDVLITDVIMPGMSGPALAEQLVQLQPDLKVIYTSGYSSEHLEQHNVPVQNITFLEKPFSSDTLARKVRQALA